MKNKTLKKELIKLKDLPKKEKIFRIVNLIIMSLFMATCITLTIYLSLTGNPNNRAIPAAAMTLFVFIPFLIEVVFRTRLSNVLFLGWEVYLLFAGLWGSVLNGYVSWPWLDVLVHILMGYLVAMLGIFVIARLGNYKTFSIWHIAFFCLIFSLAIELVWELSEWFADNFVGQVAQGPKVPGYGVPLVTDTMQDILCNTCGAIVFFIHYIIGKVWKYSLGINLIEDELVQNKNIRYVELKNKEQAVNENVVVDEENDKEQISSQDE